MSTTVWVVYVTCPNQEEARTVAEALVSEKLAACVNIVPAIQSVYWWENAIQQDEEVLLIIKTTAENFEALARRVQELHSYTVPEVIALPVTTGSRDYLAWVAKSVR